MSSLNYLLTIIVAIALAAGQLLFKMAATSPSNAGQTFLSMLFTWKFILALCVYGAATAIWVLVLRTADISRAYPIALAGAALIPIGAFFLFGERIGIRYIGGFCLVTLGLLIIATDPVDSSKRLQTPVADSDE